VFCAVFCFYPYREFKAITYNENPALRGYFENAEEFNNENEKKDPKKDDVKKVNYNPNYGEI
jgi:hypothetical protein